MSKIDNPHAFPLISKDGVHINEGMTLRDYFAAKAIQGIMASNECGIAHIPETACEWAYSIADAMLKQRTK